MFLNTAKLHDVETSLVTSDLPRMLLSFLYREKLQNCRPYTRSNQKTYLRNPLNICTLKPSCEITQESII